MCAPVLRSRSSRSADTRVAAMSTDVAPPLLTSTPVCAFGAASSALRLVRATTATASRLSSLRSAGVSDVLIFWRAAICAAALAGRAPAPGDAAVAADVVASETPRSAADTAAPTEMARAGPVRIMSAPFAQDHPECGERYSRGEAGVKEVGGDCPGAAYDPGMATAFVTCPLCEATCGLAVEVD